MSHATSEPLRRDVAHCAPPDSGKESRGQVVARCAVLCAAALTPPTAAGKRGLPVPGLRLGEVLTLGLSGIALIAMRQLPRSASKGLVLSALAYAVLTLALGTFDLRMRGAAV